MTLSDDQLRSTLERRATAAPHDLVSLARSIAVTPRPRALVAGPRLLAAGSAAASVVLAAAIAGSVAFRATVPESPPPTNTGSGPAAGLLTPSAGTGTVEPWTELVWRLGDASTFDAGGSTYVADGIADRDGYLAVGYTVAAGVTTGRLWRSPDGARWEPLAADTFPNAELMHIARLGEGYAIVGSRRAPSSGATEPSGLTVWWSADGTSWRDVTPERALGFSVGLVAAGSGGLLISIGPSRDVGRDFYLAIDPARHAELFEVARATDVRVLGLAAGGPGWIAIGATGILPPTTSATRGSLGAIWTSRDGASWSLASVDDPGGAIQSVERVAGGYVATGSDVSLPCAECLGGLVREPDVATWVSDDGTNWHRATTFASGPGVRLGDSVWLGGSRVAGDGARALLFTSSPEYQPVTRESLDGRRWDEIRNSYDADAADVELASGFDGPVIVGPDRVVAFRHAMSDGSEGNSPIPLVAIAGAGSGAATFPPNPLPTPNDQTCPNQQPCGP